MWYSAVTSPSPVCRAATSIDCSLSSTLPHDTAGARLYDPITPLLMDLHWLRMPQRIQYKLCILDYHCLHGSAPGYLQSSIIPVSDTASRHHLRSASSGDLVVPATWRLIMGDRAFAVAGPRAWNKLPDSVRQSSSLDVFKQLLKTHLFSLSFN